MRAIMALGMVLAASVVEAASAGLSCTGVSSVLKHGTEETDQPDSHSIILDTANNKLTVDNQLMPIKNISDDRIDAVLDGTFRAITVRLDITGKVFIAMTFPTIDTLVSFQGICKAT